ncbi:hypothetical protein ACRALDRAFT_1055070 [Sodiomyces alcalophilus JCM 7366]|uniref:uncharacterized protein n=1 Tax=Sodiomyces alcalophilus JCM 7366 TaxID=591952 RepID=UPI0039B6152E
MAPAACPPAGIYVPVPTFFAGKSSPDYHPASPPLDPETQGAYSVYLARSGVKGLVILGSTGEGIHLHPSERSTVLRASHRALDVAGYKDYPLIVGTATQSIAEAVEQLSQAKQDGAQWGLCLVPGYFAAAASQESIIAWFRAVADKSPIPVMVYHYPGVSNNVQCTPSTLAALAAHPNIVGCKLSHGDVSAHGLVTANPAVDPAHFAVFTGFGQQLLAVTALGAAGAIDGSAGFFPRAVVRLHDLAGKGNPTADEARERLLLQYRVSGVYEFVLRFGIVGVKEAVSRLRGFGEVGGARAPLLGGLPGGDEEWAKWKGIFEPMEDMEKSVGGL